MYIVLITSGKREDVETASVMLFEGPELAQEYVDSVNQETGTKYWRKAQIVSEGVATDDICGYREN